METAGVSPQREVSDIFMIFDLTNSFAVAQFVETFDRWTAREFLEDVFWDVPYQSESSLFKSGTPFSEQLGNKDADHNRLMRLDLICEVNGLKPRMTKPNQASTKG